MQRTVDKLSKLASTIEVLHHSTLGINDIFFLEMIEAFASPILERAEADNQYSKACN